MPDPANVSCIRSVGTTPVVKLAPIQSFKHVGIYHIIFLKPYRNFIVQANPETKKPAASKRKQPVKSDHYN